MIKDSNYPQWFLDFWNELNQLRTRNLGSKWEAYQQALSLKIGPEDTDFLITCFKKQTNLIRNNRKAGKWMEDHSDICRWLKRRTWEEFKDTKQLTDQEFMQELFGDKLKQLTDRSWAND